MAIPRYKAQPFQENTYKEQLGAADATAQEQGQLKIGQQEKALGGAHNAGANLAVKDLSTKLKQFNDSLATGLNAGVYAFQKDAQNKGIEHANDELVNQNNKIREIQNNTKLKPEERIDQINQERTKLKSNLEGIYGDAYNSTVKSNFNNQVSVDAQKMIQEVSKMSGDNPLKFKELWQEYTKSNLEFAPDAASKLLQERVYDKAGMVEYSRIAKAAQAKQKKVNKENSTLAETNLNNLYINRLQVGDIGGADEAKVAYENKIKSDLAQGIITQSKAEQKLRDFSTKGFITSNRYKFDTALEQGGGISYFDAFQKKMGSLDMNLYNPKEIQSHRNYMEKALENEFAEVTERLTKSLEQGVKPDPEDLKRLAQYSRFGDADTYKKINTKLVAQEALLKNANLKMSEQIKNQEPIKAGDSVEVIETKQELIKQTQARKTKAQKDPISLGQDEGLYEEVSLTPGTPDFQKNLKTRAVQSEIAGQKYDITAQKFLTQPEVKEIKDFLLSDSPVQEKLALIKSFKTLSDKHQELVYQQIDQEDKLMGQVTRVLKDGKDGTAMAIMEGQQLMKQPFMAAVKTELKKEVTIQVQDMMMVNPKRADRLQQSIMSLYAYKVSQGNPDQANTDFQPDILEASITEILGAKADKGYAPPGVQADDFEDWYDWVIQENYIDDSEPGDIPLTKNTTEHWQTVNQLADAYPVRLEGNKYFFVYKGKQLQTQDNKPYILEYNKRD